MTEERTDVATEDVKDVSAPTPAESVVSDLGVEADDPTLKEGVVDEENDSEDSEPRALPEGAKVRTVEDREEEAE